MSSTDYLLAVYQWLPTAIVADLALVGLLTMRSRRRR